MEYFGSFLFLHGSSLIDFLKEFPIFAILHKDVDLVLFANDLIDLCNVLMHQIFLQFYFTLDGFQLFRLVLLHCGYLHCHCLASKAMDCLLDFSETALADSLF